MIEDILMESDTGEAEEGDFGEMDDAFGEAEDSADDLGESSRRRRRAAARRYYRPSRGVTGMRLRGQDGKIRSLPFPTKLATAEETNRGLATQEVARRALAERLDRMELRLKSQQKKDAAASGLVTLFLGGGLATVGIVGASHDKGGLGLGTWAARKEADAAALVSLTQVATSGAKLAINGRYHRSGFGVAADIFSVGLIAVYSLGKFHKPKNTIAAHGQAEIKAALANATEGDIIIDTSDNNREYVVIRSVNLGLLAVPVSPAYAAVGTKQNSAAVAAHA